MVQSNILSSSWSIPACLLDESITAVSYLKQKKSAKQICFALFLSPIAYSSIITLISAML
jgi:hypothetical protein